jgi:Tfp pilus assembly protein PilF
VKHAALFALAWLTGLAPLAAQEAPETVSAGDVDTVDVKRLSPLVRGRIALAMEHIELNEYAEAKKVLADTIDRFPEAEQAEQMLVAVLLQLNLYEEANQRFSELMLRHPDDFRLLNNYAWFLATATDRSYRDPVRALALAQDAVLRAPQIYNVWSTLAQAHYTNGNFDQAVKALEQCLQLAMAQKAPESALRNYAATLQKFRDAAKVMSLVE